METVEAQKKKRKKKRKRERVSQNGGTWWLGFVEFNRLKA